MKLFQLDESYNVIWEPQVALIKPFAAILKRDRSKSKTRANRELAFVFFYCDIKSDYMFHTDPAIREEAIKGDLQLDKSWKIDKVMQEAIDYYDAMSTSITSKILKDSTYVADKLSTRMRALVDDEDLDIGEIDKLLNGIKKMPDVISSLQKAESAVLKEISEEQGRLGSKEKALFEDGL